MNPSRSRITPEPFPNETRAARALRACADQGSGIRDQGFSKTIHVPHGRGILRAASASDGCALRARGQR